MTGFGSAWRLAFRRNRMFYLWWILGLSVLMPLTVTKYHDLVPAGESGQLVLAQLAGNPTMLALLGPAFDLGNAGGFTFWRVGTFTAAAVAMMAALGVIRATRAEEEEGRAELIRAGATSRSVPLAAGVALGLAACLVLGLASQDCCENALAELGLDNVRLSKPVHHGDTLYAYSEVLETRDADQPDAGIVVFRHYGYNQREELCVQVERTVLLKRRSHWLDKV